MMADEILYAPVGQTLNCLFVSSEGEYWQLIRGRNFRLPAVVPYLSRDNQLLRFTDAKGAEREISVHACWLPDGQQWDVWNGYRGAVNTKYESPNELLEWIAQYKGQTIDGFIVHEIEELSFP